MSKLFKNKVFRSGFLVGLIISAVVNYVDYIGKANINLPTHTKNEFGFPFDFYRWGGYVSEVEILWLGLIANILIAIIFSFLLGLISSLFGRKSQRED